MLKMRKAFLIFAALMLAVVASVNTFAGVKTAGRDEKNVTEKSRVEAPLNLAVLIQDDVVARVG